VSSICSNSQAILVPLERIATRARVMFDSRAFVHQYAAHGIGLQGMEQRFLAVEQVIASYREAL
jgi:hypothetical protein